MEPSQITISLYENAIPDFVEAELNALYGHVYSSLSQFRIYGAIRGTTHTYVAQQNGRISAVLLFRCEGNKALVLNEQIDIDAEQAVKFVRYIFDMFPSIDVVRFHAIRTKPRRFPFPLQQFYRTEDIVLRLPRSADEYLARLAKSTRRNIKYYTNRLKRNYPALDFAVSEDSAINTQHVHDIVAMNHARMRNKNKDSEMDHAETERLLALARQSGMVCVMMLGGRVIAGTVCSRVGSHYFMHVIAHDPAYDDARIGTLCCYQTIADCIARGAEEFHFLWGRFEYKYMLLGVQRNFDEILAYRSHAHMALNIRTVLSVAWQGHMRTLKFWLLDLADRPDENSVAARLAFRLLNGLRNLKRSGFRLAAPR